MASSRGFVAMSAEFGDISDRVLYTAANVTYLFVCQKVGASISDSVWACQRITTGTSSPGVTKTVTRWARKGDTIGAGSYFCFQASNMESAKDYFGDY